MLKAIRLAHFKSYGEEQALPLAPLTVLIGANASGKSNLLEGLQLLAWMARGHSLGDLTQALRTGELAMRGQPSELHPPNDCLRLGCDLDDDVRLTLDLRIDHARPRIVFEELSAPPEARSSVPYAYQVQRAAGEHENHVPVAYNNFARGKNKPQIDCIDSQAIFTQLRTPARFDAAHTLAQQTIPALCDRVAGLLTKTLWLNPDPRAMRGYSYKDEGELNGDGGNLSAVLFSLTRSRQHEAEILAFVRSLPEQDIVRLDFHLGPRNDVMVRLVETFGGRETTHDAAVLSDGTLRVLAVAAAALSVPEGALVIIEEIDNGVHPSRAKMLIAALDAVARRRRLRLLLTTHNPALLDAVPKAAIGDTVACYRDPISGHSRLVRLSDLEDYPALVAQGALGWLSASGTLDRFLKERRDDLQKERALQETLALLRGAAG